MSFSFVRQMRIAFLVLAVAAAAVPATASEFYPIDPCRLYDSRGGDGLRDMWDPTDPDPQHKEDATYTVPIVGVVIPDCGAAPAVPADAVAVSVNVTIIGASRNGYVQVFPAGTILPPPPSSPPSPPIPPGAVAFSQGRTLGSFHQVPLGPGGDLSFLATVLPPPPPPGTYHIAFDVFGYYSNSAPLVTTTEGATAFIEDGGPVVVDSGVVVTDADSANLVSATVTIMNPQNGADEVIGATNCAGLTLTPGLNSLSITGSQPPATYQTCLQSVTYNNISDNPVTAPARKIVFIADDGTVSSFGAIKMVTVAVANDAPVVTTTAGTTSFTEDGGAVVVDSGVTVTDGDNANLASATVTITNPQDGAAEVLAATSCGALTVTPGLNSLSITGSQPLATYQTCLQSVTYDNSSQNPDPTSRVIEFVANDGTTNSAAASKTVTVGGDADAPVVTTTPGTTGFTEGAGAVVVDAGVTVTDPDDTNLESATVSLASAPDGASEVLSATSCAGLTVTPGNPLTITGSQPLATYQACLQSVTYNNTAQNPTTSNRTVNFVANDGDNNSDTASKTVSVAAVNNAPVVTTTAGTTAFTENAGAVVVDSGVTVTDADDTNLESATVSLVSAPDGASEVLSATSCAGLTVTPGNPLTISGSQPLATYQICLQSVTYNNTSETPDETNRTVNFVVNDGDNNSNTASKTVSVASVNDLPVVTTTAGITPFTEDAGAVVVDNGVTVTDADDVNLESATVSLAAAPDGASEVLSATSCAGLTVTPGNPLTITGSQSLATYQTCLQSVTYNNTSQSPNAANRTVNFVVNDGDNNSNTASKTVSVTAANDLPVVTTTAGTTAFIEDAGAVVVDSGVTVSDADDVNLESATVSLVSAPDGASEVLSATSCAGLTVTPGNPLTITGSQPVAVYQTCLQSVTYNNSSQAPNTANRTVNFVVNDGDNNSNTASKTVSVTSVNDLPVVTTTAGITPFVEDAGTVVIDNGLTVTDADDTNLESATVSLVAAPDGASEVLSATSCAGLTVTPGNPLTITGSQPLAVYQTCLRSVTYNNASQNPNTTDRTVNFVVNDGDGNSNTASKTVSVTAVNDPPVPQVNPVSYATAGNTQLHVEGKVLAGVVSVSDTQGVDAKAIAFTDPDGPVAPAIVNNDAGVSANGGSFDIDTDGSFTYVPPAGFTGTDSFTYQITDTVTPANATVSVVVTEMVWYVHDVVAPGNPGNPAAGDTGRSNNAFEVLQDAINAAGPDDYVFVFRGNTGATPHAPATILNKDGLKLIGQGFGLSVLGYPNLVLAGAEPNEAVIQNAAVTAAEDNALQVTINAGIVDAVEIRGFAITATDNAIDVTVSGAATAGVTISHNQIGTTAMEGIDVNHGSTSALSTVAVHDNVLLTGGNAIDIARTNGTLKITAFDDNAVSGDTNASGIVVTGPNVSFDSIPGTGALDAVLGGITRVGDSVNTVTGSGMAMSQVSGSLSFTDLDLYAGGSGLVVLGTGAFTGAAGTNIHVTPATPDGIGTSTIVAGSGPAVDVSTATADLRLSSLTSSGTTSTGVSLTNVADGTTNAFFSAPSGSSITAASGAGPAFNVSGGNSKITYAGTITNNGTGRAVSITTWAGDDVGDDLLFSGAIDENGAGILLNGNGGSRSITFSGGMDIDTTSGEGFAATSNTNSGGLHITGTNTIDSISATALRVTSTTIGNSNLNFRSISAGNNTAAADPANGIVLSNTGSSGGLIVTGNGGACTEGSSTCTGGWIRNMTGGDDSGVTPGGTGIVLNNTANVSLTRVRINDTSNYGIHGTNVSGFTFTNGVVDGANGTNVNTPFNEGSVVFFGVTGTSSGMTGTSSITNSTIMGGRQRNIAIDNSVGTLNLTVSGNTIKRTSDAAGDDGFFLEADTTANVTLAITGNTFARHGGDHINVTMLNSAVVDATITGNTLHGNYPGTPEGNHPIGLTQGIFVFGATFNGTCTYEISNNGTVAMPFRGNRQGGAIHVNKGSGTGTFSGSIENNVIGDPAVTGSGSAEAFGIIVGARGSGAHTTLINNNQIRQYFDRGIVLEAGEGSAALNATVTNNSVSNFADATNSLHGIHSDNGILAGDTNPVCLQISGNSVATAGNEPAGGADIRLRRGSNTTVRLPGVAGPSNAQATTLLQANNPAATTITVTGNGFSSGAACPLP